MRVRVLPFVPTTGTLFFSCSCADSPTPKRYPVLIEYRTCLNGGEFFRFVWGCADEMFGEVTLRRRRGGEVALGQRMIDIDQNSNHVCVYGGDHSPWVQAVLLGLHEKNIPHTVVTVPPLSVFLNSGILMPAARIGDGSWMLDSAKILGELGFAKVDGPDRRALQVLFGVGALQRTLEPWDFWYRWSYLRDGQASLALRLWNHLRRPFSVFYFFTLITLGRLRRRQRTEEELIEDFVYWEQRLDSGSPFLGGEAPDTVDLQLFGQLQMFSSIPGRSLHVIQEAAELERLRGWVERMQARFGGFGHLYSGPYFEPQAPAPQRASHLERLFYWLGCALIWIGLPISLAATFFFVHRVGRKQLR